MISKAKNYQHQPRFHEVIQKIKVAQIFETPGPVKAE